MKKTNDNSKIQIAFCNIENGQALRLFVIYEGSVMEQADFDVAQNDNAAFVYTNRRNGKKFINDNVLVKHYQNKWSDEILEHEVFI